MAKSPEVKLAVFGRAGVGKSGKKKNKKKKKEFVGVFTVGVSERPECHTGGMFHIKMTIVNLCWGAAAIAACLPLVALIFGRNGLALASCKIRCFSSYTNREAEAGWRKQDGHKAT